MELNKEAETMTGKTLENNRIWTDDKKIAREVL